MRRRLFTLASALSLLLAFLLGIQCLFSIAVTRPSFQEIYWTWSWSLWIGDGSLLVARDIARDQFLEVPYWFILGIAAILPACWLRVAWRHRGVQRRIRHGLCPNCGYNLTGNTSGVCPECGNPFSHKAKVGACGGRRGAGGCWVDPLQWRLVRGRLYSLACVLSLLLSLGMVALWPQILAFRLTDVRFLAAFVICSWLLPRRLGLLGILASQLITAAGFIVMAGLALEAGSDWYDGPLSLAGPLLQAFAFNVLLLPVAATAAWRRAVICAAPDPNDPTCQHCGYNLTGNTSSTCPECGTVPSV